MPDFSGYTKPMYAAVLSGAKSITVEIPLHDGEKAPSAKSRSLEPSAMTWGGCVKSGQ